MSDVPGRIAYVGADANIYVLVVDSGSVIQLTDDAGARRHYQWPTWSTNDKLAFFCCDPAFSGRRGIEVFVSPDGVVDAELVYEDGQPIFTYASWSPADCELGDKCRDLAVLMSGSLGFDVQLIRVHDEVTNKSVGQGAPFYYSWSPDADRLLLQRNDNQLDIYTVISEDLQRLLQSPGAMQAPSWSPVDERLLFGALDSESQSTDLVIVEGDEVEVVADDLVGLVGSNWSADGNYVAYRTVTDEFGDLIVYDTISHEDMVRTNVGGVIAFFWSPDSSQIAFVTFEQVSGASNISTAQQDDLEGLAWWSLDITTGQTTRLAGFVPTSEMVYTLNFFDQFSQSHSLWSPDSSHLVFSEIVDGESKISLIDMRQPKGLPLVVADGVIGIWSYR